MDLELALSILGDLDAVSARLRAALAPSVATLPPPPPPPIATVAGFDAAYVAAAPGDVLTLANALRYDRFLTLDKPIVLRSETPFNSGTRMTDIEPAPSFVAGMSITGPQVALIGIEIRHTNPLSTILTVSGSDTHLERVRILGDAVKGAKRGINYTGSNGLIVDSYIDDIFQPAQDTQAIYSDNMGPGTLVINNCYLRAAGEVVMFGGADPSSPDRQPHDVTLNNSILDKRAEWTTANPQQVKCSLELKNIRGFQSKGCTFRLGGGISQGQGGYAFDLTVRNQNGKAPESCVQDVVIEDFTIEQPGSGIASISGYDSNFPSGKLRNMVIRRGTVTGVDYKTLPGTTGRLFTFDHAPEAVTIQDIAVAGINIRSICYFQGLQPPTGLVLANITVDNAGVAIPYRYKLDGNTHLVGVNWPTNAIAALRAYMPDCTLDASVA